MWRCGSPECDCEGRQKGYLARDQSAAKALVRTLTPLVDAIVQKKLPRTRSDERAEVRQDIFLLVFRNLASWRGECPFCLWVRQIAIRAAYDQSRRNLRVERIGKAPDDPDKLVDPKPPPFGPQIWECIDRTVGRLPADQRRAYELHWKEDKTIEETAKTVGTSVRTIYTWLDRIKLRLLDCLD